MHYPWGFMLGNSKLPREYMMCAFITTWRVPIDTHTRSQAHQSARTCACTLAHRTLILTDTTETVESEASLCFHRLTHWKNDLELQTQIAAVESVQSAHSPLYVHAITSMMKNKNLLMFDLSIPKFHNPVFHCERAFVSKNCDFYINSLCQGQLWGSAIKHEWTHKCNALGGGDTSIKT